MVDQAEITMSKRQRISIAALACLFFACGWTIVCATQVANLEYKVKAAFLLNFAKFTIWEPPVPSARHDFPLCIVGDDPFGEALNGVEEKTVAGQPVRLLRSSNLNADLASCRLLFISNSEHGRIKHILQFADEHRIVTVSDINGFASAGGIFELRNKDGRLSFVVNNNKAKHIRIQISSALLNLAIEVL